MSSGAYCGTVGLQDLQDSRIFLLAKSIMFAVINAPIIFTYKIPSPKNQMPSLRTSLYDMCKP